MSGMSAGTACFLIKDDSLRTNEGEFWDYLKKEGFTPGESTGSGDAIGYM